MPIDVFDANARARGSLFGLFDALSANTTNTTPQLDGQSSGKSLEHSKVVIVDDDALILDALQKHLADAGYRNVVCTSSSETALRTIQEESPDLLLLDIMMPVNGLLLLEQVRSDDGLSRVPIVVLTASKDTQTKLEALRLGANDFLTKPVDVVELLTRVRNNLIVKSHIDELSSYSKRLEQAVYVDALTGMMNRRGFQKEVQERLKALVLDGQPQSLLIVDIDHFKKVNDCYGHRAGDILLRDVAQAIQRNVDADAVVCRYGGEEFTVLQMCRDEEQVIQTAEAIRSDIEQNVFNFDELQLNVTVSLGISLATERDTEYSLFQRADSALYCSKQSGRNCTHFNDGHDCMRIGEEEPKSTNVGVVCLNGITGQTVKDAKIMIVDDDPVMILVIKKHLKDGGFWNFVSSSEPTEVLTMVRVEQPDIVLMDVHMPQVTGLQILEQIRSAETINHIPVVIVTSSKEEDTKSTALELAANDFLGKPVDPSELISRVRNNLLVKAQHDQLTNYSQKLEFEINRRTAELFSSRDEVIYCLASAAEYRDDQTGHHTVRVGLYAGIIARELELDSDILVHIEAAAQLHDVGKIGVSDIILKKQGTLTDQERATMQGHAEMGQQILKKCQSPIMRMAAKIAASHHEKWDGSGYPQELAGEQIPIEGRITAVADVFDALSTKRYYKDAFELEECFKLIKDGSGSHFDPAVVAAFFRCKAEITKVYQDYADA